MPALRCVGAPVNEAETCRSLVRPKLRTVGLPAAERASFYREQMHVTAGLATGKVQLDMHGINSPIG